jgi:hypothetical protein
MNGKSAAQYLVDGFRLGGRLDYDQFFRHHFLRKAATPLFIL